MKIKIETVWGEGKSKVRKKSEVSEFIFPHEIRHHSKSPKSIPKISITAQSIESPDPRGQYRLFIFIFVFLSTVQHRICQPFLNIHTTHRITAQYLNMFHYLIKYCIVMIVLRTLLSSSFLISSHLIKL